MQILRRPAELLYTVLSSRTKLVNSQVKLCLEQLHPGDNRETLCRAFYVQKLERSLLLLSVGLVLAGLLTVREKQAEALDAEDALKRGDVLEEAQDVRLEGTYGGRQAHFLVKMYPRQLDGAELEDWYARFCAALPQLILGQNTSLEAVDSPLALSEEYEEYPFAVQWRSSRPDVVTSTGEIQAGAEAQDALLTATISYLEREWQYTVPVTVRERMRTEDQRAYEEVAALLECAEAASRGEEYWILPDRVEDARIIWQRDPDRIARFVWMGVPMLVVAIFFLSDTDLQKDLEKRKKVMQKEYPDIVHKLALYLGAGMTLRAAFQRIGTEYEQQQAQQRPGRQRARQQSGLREKDVVYEQVLITCRELRSGLSEAEAYAQFGKRIGLQEYIRLTTLMTQNLKKGSASLLERLRDEADRSLSEQMQRGRQLGEEASTKLLLPMVMMLGVVMVMVIMPAFGSMGM